MRGAAVVVGVAVALLLTEAGMRLAGLGSPVDGTDVMQSYSPADIFRQHADPEVGIGLKPGYSGRQLYHRATDGTLVHEAVTNVTEEGYRRESTRTEGKLLLAVGDSTTFGVGVSDGESWPAALEETLDPSWRVRNAGVPGRNTAQEIAWLRTLGGTSAPSVVILAFYLNDLSVPIPLGGDVQPNRMPAPPWATREAGARRISRIYNLWWRSRERRTLARSIAGSTLNYIDEINRNATKDVFKVRFEQLRHACDRLRATPVVALLPVLDVSDPRAADPLFAKATEGAALAGVRLIHAEHALDDFDIPDRIVLPGERHASVKANARIAEVIRAGLGGILSPSK